MSVAIFSHLPVIEQAISVRSRTADDMTFHAALVPGQMLLHYRLLEPIGEGGMGVVWKAFDTTLEREVALKVLPHELTQNADLLRRYEQEARLLAALNHPNVAMIYGLHQIDAVHFFMMELVDGEDLSTRVKGGALPLATALTIGTQVAAALETTHARGITHRDLKPGNIRLTPQGVVKVLDFGVAKALAPPPESARMSRRTGPSRHRPARRSARPATCAPSRRAETRSARSATSGPSGACSSKP